MLGLGLYGIFFYVLAVIVIGLHNLYTAIVVWKAKEIKRIIVLAFLASIIWSLFFLFVFFSNSNAHAILFIGYLCALIYSVEVLNISTTRRIGKVILIYNILGTSIVALKMLSGYGIDFTGIFSGISHTITLSHSLFEMVNFSFLQIFYPTLLIPPVLFNPKKSHRMLGKVGSIMAKIMVGYAITSLVLMCIPAFIMISSFSEIPVYSEDYRQTPMKFGVKVNSFANEAKNLGDWEELLLKELQIADELRIDYLDFYVDRSYLEDSLKNQRLREGLTRIREEGFGIILACMGSPDWLFNPPSLEVHNRVLQEDALKLAQFHPDYLIIVVEPLARHNGMMLKEPMPIETWVLMINETASKVKMLDENIKVAATIAAAEEEGLALFLKLQNSNLDAVGIDVHPFHADMIDIVYGYHHSVHTKELWVFEFGMETYNFGEETQARYMSYLPKVASDLNLSGVVQYDIMDNPQSQLGLVYPNGERKLGFYSYKNAIEKVRGNHFDFSEIMLEKEKDNGILVLIAISIFSCVVLKRMKTRIWISKILGRTQQKP
ncbi:MAG: hypothetical protein HXS44_06690 [Theionarchaea archaeon]|nr:hypothetical protein [Theionarchaea archaeon]